jgi:hypothetical protein
VLVDGRAGPSATVVEFGSSAAVAYATPDRSRPIGTVRRGAVLPVTGTAQGAGCGDSWLEVGGRGWVCGDVWTPREGRPRAAPWPPPPGTGDPLPFRYVHPRGHDRQIYESLPDAAQGTGGEPLTPGTWESVAAEMVRGGVPLFRTVSGRFVRQEDVRWAEASPYAGLHLHPDDAPWPFAVVAADRAVVYARVPANRWDPGEPTGRRLPRYAVVRVAEADAKSVRLAEAQRLRRRDVRLLRVQPPPEGIAARERWIDIDLTEQVLVAYEGAVPRFASLVSTGRGTLTPEGSFRIYRAAGTVTMRGEIAADGLRTYVVHDVPWALFFDEDRAIHAAFWHDDFGTARSHGCVNLPPLAARWVFSFASPSLPDGWIAIDAVEPRGGTLVRVRR